MKKKLKSTVYYSSNFKEKVLSEVLNGQISAEGARKKYNIGGKMTVYRWLDAYNNSKEKKVLSLSDMDKKEKKEQQVIPEELADLKQQLEEALLKAEAYKTLLEIGKEEFGIDLEKKYGAKQSKN